MKKYILSSILYCIGLFVHSQTTTYQQRLFYTCKVWGFVKYYHSGVSNCQVNWDSVLTATLPVIKNASSGDELNTALASMLAAAGPMQIATSPSPDTLPAELKRNLNFGWINDPVFRADIKTILDTIKNNFRPHEICWVKENDYTSSNYGWLLFPYDDPMTNGNMYLNYPGEFTRLLVFFKYWNIINYFNPYNYLQDKPMDSTLYNYVLPIATTLSY